MCEIIILPPGILLSYFIRQYKKKKKKKKKKKTEQKNIIKNERSLFISILLPFVFNSAVAASSTPLLSENLRGGLN